MATSEAAKKARNEYMKKWREKNKEHLKNYRKKYREEHPEKVKASQECYWTKKAAEAKGAHE